MAAASPAFSTNGGDAVAAAAAASLAPPKTLRGLNKPKCIQCGNVARSRCPYQSCKSCCSRAQNPCHIHVLKANATFPEKAPTSSTPVFEQPPTEVSPAQNSLRAAAVRQLSSTFSQFNNLLPLRSRKPLSKKEAIAINEWRFSKLKEYKERNIEVENEAFDRYMLNISLLEDVLSVKSLSECSTEDGSFPSIPVETSEEGNSEKMITEQKLKLRSNPVRSENVRKRMQQIVDQGLRKLQKREPSDSVSALTDPNEIDKWPEKAGVRWAEKTSALNDLIDKLNKARNEEDLKACLEMKAQLYSQNSRSSQTGAAKDTPGTPTKELDFLSQKLYRTVEIDPEDLKTIDVHFATLEKIEDL
ncbi:hypothetical protein Tsubulata_004617 [Turnera subulata]|uniref:Uncharacterized protein n=1 Tax=Turnera subulata TaxID=218843 RepID=A0A9Q0JMA0_9ROSI|nr:hypothetical protein Tsubulata_004617 [Turnera subulata]